MDIYFTRHGKTEWNQEGRFQGMHGDSPLLETSYQEIALLGEHLKAIPFEKIYASTSLRARKTAEGIQQHLNQPTEILYRDDLRELGLGELEGQSIEASREKYGVILDNMRYHLDWYQPESFGGEPIMEAIQRITKVVNEASQTAKGPLLFVGHGASLSASIQWLAGKPLSELREMGGLFNNSLSILEKSNQQEYQLKIWNDTSFLH